MKSCSCCCTKVINFFALLLIIAGALNWGLWGFFQFDMVAWLFKGGNTGMSSRIVYSIIGLAGVWGLGFFSKCKAICSADEESSGHGGCCGGHGKGGGCGCSSKRAKGSKSVGFSDTDFTEKGDSSSRNSSAEVKGGASKSEKGEDKPSGGGCGGCGCGGH